MNRRHGHGHGGRDRRPNYGGGDGLLGEGPGFGGGMFEPMVNTQMNQLMIAQQLLQQQAALGGAGGFGGGGELGTIGALAGAMGNMQFLQHQGMGYSGGLGMRNDRKRVGGQSRDMDFKRRRRDSSGRGGDRDRSRGRDGNRSGDGRDRNHSSRSESDKDRHRSKEEDYDPAEPTEDDEVKDKDSNLYCHVCNVSVYDDESFRRHLNGTKHTQRMNSVLTVHQMKSNQLKSRLKAEEHLRKIEGKRGGYDPNFFCKICNNSLTIPWERHRFSNIHKQRQLQVKRGCGWCKVHDFTNFTEVLMHRETEEHKKNAEIYGKKKDEKESGRSRSRSRERRTEKHRKSSSSHDRSRKDKDRKLREKKKDEDEDLSIPEYNAENAVGLSYIIPVTGFFCKLCHKFYNNEKSAKGAHCQSESHYEKFKLATEAKIAAKEQRQAEEAAEEKEKKTNEEDSSKNIDGNNDEGLESKEETGNNGSDFKKTKTEDDEYDENYDDPLPIEDLDNDGGLAKEDDYGLLDDDEANATVSDPELNYDTDANSSSAFLSGDMAETETEKLQKGHLDSSEEAEAESQLGSSKQDISEMSSQQTGDEIDEDETAADVSVEEKEEDVSVNPEEEDEVSTSNAPSSEPLKAAGKPRGATARRGRGRGKAKK